MAGSILGTAVRRVEDPELLTGRSTFVDNLRLVGALYLAFVRSPVAHARVAGIDTTEARAVPGVVAVFTAADLDLPAHHGLITVNPALPRPPLATDRVRFVGEAVAVVAAETAEAAADAAGLVEVDYEPLDAVVDPEEAVAPGAPLQFPTWGRTSRPGSARRTARTRWPARTSSCGRGSSTSGSRSCRWRATRSRWSPDPTVG